MFNHIKTLILLKTVKSQILNRLTISFSLLILSGCSSPNSIFPQTHCGTAIAIATQTWEVNYYTNKTAGGLNAQRRQSFQSNRLINFNSEKPENAASGPDDTGIWWAALPPRPTIDEIDQHRELQEQNDPPRLQREVTYQLGCDKSRLSTNAQLYREAARAIHSRKKVRVSYFWNHVLSVEGLEPSKS
jgi:hypothetical protein